MTTTQLTVRIDKRLAEWVDEVVAAEHASGRAAIVARALERERRRLAAEHDARIYAEHGEDPELDGFMQWAARQPIEID